MTPPSLTWLRLELGTPRGVGDPRLLIDGRCVDAAEFHRALVRVDHAVFALAMADAITEEPA